MSLPRETLARYITPGCTFVETGTRWGDSLIRAAELGAARVLSCESDGIMAAIASEHVRDYAERMGIFSLVKREDSVIWLRVWMEHSSGDCILFLDAHTDRYSPICEELDALSAWREKPRLILIDDVRLFRSRQWGISLDDVLAAVRAVGDYEIGYDTGIQPEDVLVARLR